MENETIELLNIGTWYSLKELGNGLVRRGDLGLAKWLTTNYKRLQIDWFAGRVRRVE